MFTQISLAGGQSFFNPVCHLETKPTDLTCPEVYLKYLSKAVYPMYFQIKPVTHGYQTNKPLM